MVRFFRESLLLDKVTDSAPEGRVIDRCESFLLSNGRDFLRRVLESALQIGAENLEKKGRRLNLPVRGVWSAQGKRVQEGDDRSGGDRSLACLFHL